MRGTGTPQSAQMPSTMSRTSPRLFISTSKRLGPRFRFIGHRTPDSPRIRIPTRNRDRTPGRPCLDLPLDELYLAETEGRLRPVREEDVNEPEANPVVDARHDSRLVQMKAPRAYANEVASLKAVAHPRRIGHGPPPSPFPRLFERNESRAPSPRLRR